MFRAREARECEIIYHFLRWTFYKKKKNEETKKSFRKLNRIWCSGRAAVTWNCCNSRPVRGTIYNLRSTPHTRKVHGSKNIYIFILWFPPRSCSACYDFVYAKHSAQGTYHMLRGYGLGHGRLAKRKCIREAVANIELPLAIKRKHLQQYLRTAVWTMDSKRPMSYTLRKIIIIIVISMEMCFIKTIYYTSGAALKQRNFIN